MFPLKSPTIIVYQQKREHGAGHSNQAHRHQGGEVHEEEALWKYFQIGQGSAKKKRYTGKQGSGPGGALTMR